MHKTETISCWGFVALLPERSISFFLVIQGQLLTIGIFFRTTTTYYYAHMNYLMYPFRLIGCGEFEIAAVGSQKVKKLTSRTSKQTRIQLKVQSTVVQNNTRTVVITIFQLHFHYYYKNLKEKTINMAPSAFVKGAEPFACGGSAATFASCVIHPMDLAKVRKF